MKKLLTIKAKYDEAIKNDNNSYDAVKYAMEGAEHDGFDVGGDTGTAINVYSGDYILVFSFSATIYKKVV